MINNHISNNYQDYISRINRVIDYIDNNLDKILTLKELSAVANFSPFHFHRIFRAFVGEPLAQYINRIRLEKAATMLYNMPDKSITAVALDCGYSSSATFARAFKDTYKISASKWINAINSPHSKIRKPVSNSGKSLSNIGKDLFQFSSYISDVNQQLTWRIQMKAKPELKSEIVVKNINELTVAYVRNIGPYKNDSALFGRLIDKICKWAGPRGLLSKNTKIISIYHDNPELTAEDKQRISICVEVPASTEVSGEVGKMTIPGGQYAVAHFELGMGEFEEAWNMVYNGWLPESGYQPDDRPCYEAYLNDPKDHPEHKFVMDIVVAVKPL